MVKNNKLKILITSSIALLCSVVIFLCVSTVIPVFSTNVDFDIDADDEYTYVYDGHTFKCYKFNPDGETPVPGVAIAWGEDPKDAPNTGTLVIPSEVTIGEGIYTVRAIAHGGFRYCDFEHVSIPNTVEEIKEEAFAYCTNLKDIDLPYLIDRIAPSTFLDCRALEYVHYLKSDGTKAFGNSRITSIGDHAFDSCISLKDFYTPSSVTYFGESCFQRCKKIKNFYFPSTQRSGDTITNYITVRPYAFADCNDLIFVYFETNMGEIDNYAFTDNNLDLVINYNGTETAEQMTTHFYRDGVCQNHWRDVYITSSSNDLIPMVTKHPTIYSDNSYPCLRYTVEDTPVKLDSAQKRATKVTLITQDDINTDGPYAVLYKFDTPAEDVDGCFDVDDGRLTIPDELGGYKVKVIATSCFANNEFIKEVKFNKSLVQIKNKAFLNSREITDLDFTLCEELKEISYQVFQDGTVAMTNVGMDHLILPDCLEYIGGYAFSCFVNVNEFHLSSNMKCIDDLAFYRLGYNITDAQVDLVLPKTLNDKAAEDALYQHLTKIDGNFSHNNYSRLYAVGKYAFCEAGCIRSVVMEEDTGYETDTSTSHSCSFYSNSFNGARNLIRFKASKNLRYFGKDAFKNCGKLREVFLTTYKSQATGNNYPWCIDEEKGGYGGTLFFGTSAEVVVYVDGNTAPGLLDTYSLATENSSVQINHAWNAETNGSYYNEIKPATDYDFTNATGNNTTNENRETVPTYYGVDFATGIKYWNPSTKAIYDTAPVDLEDYNAGVIAFVKDKTNKYSVARYYYTTNEDAEEENTEGTAVDYIDLTQVPDISDGTTNLLENIGQTAFAHHEVLANDIKITVKHRSPGLYFVLPTTIKTIGERAFYRRTGNAEKGNGRFGARIITYKSGDKYIDSDGSTLLTQEQFNAKITTLESNLDKDKRGYCVLHDDVTSIGKLAFYNNIFDAVRLGSKLNFIGHGAFMVNTDGTNGRNTITTLTIAANSYFEMDAGGQGLYYIGGGNSKKMLMYQTANNTGDANGKYKLADNTKAIGLDACSNTQYKIIELPTGLTTIYGGGLAKNLALEKITGVDDLRYIGAMKNAMGADTDFTDDDYTEVWDDTVGEHFDNSDYRQYAFKNRGINESLYGAVLGCTALEEIDFTSMTELRKIGPSAFNGCSKMKKMCGSKEYTFLDNTKGGAEITGRSARNENVLDLSYCTHLRSIDSGAFNNCSSIKYLILPDNRETSTSQSAIYVGKDLEALRFNKGFESIINNSMSVLIREPASYSDYNFGQTNGSRNHYASNSLNKGNKYYFCKGTDLTEFNYYVPTTDKTTLRYWTIDASGNYVLLGTANQARAYFGFATI